MWRLVFPVLAHILMAAHLMFHGMMWAMLLPAALLILLLVPARWIRYCEMFFLSLYALEWVRAACVLASERMANGEPWHRAFVIVAACGAFSGLAATMFLAEPVKNRFKLG